jgi:multisubunit Na+/H+ antiporter MnhC subunit
VVKDFLFIPMSSVTGHFVRRGVDVAYANYQAQDPEKKQPSGLQVFGLILTALVLGLAMFSVSTTVAITRSMVNLS